MKVRDVPHAWMRVQIAAKKVDENYKMQSVPEYVKLARRYKIDG